MALSKIQTAVITDNAVTTTKLFADNLGRRNMLINGDFQVWQRGTSGTVNSYTCDRWFGWGYQQTLTRQQAENAASNTGRFALRVAHNDATSNQFSAIAQTLETNDTAKVRGKKLTFSVDVKKGSAFTGSLTLQIVTRTDSEASINAGTRQVLVTEDITSSLTTSLQRFSCTTSSVVGQDALVVGVNINHTGTSGTDANNFFQVERAQLEISDAATDFESIPFGETLSLCQRYYYRINPTDGYQRFSPFHYITTTLGETIIRFPVRMRVEPTFENTGTVGNYAIYVEGNIRAVTGDFAINAASSDDSATIRATTSAAGDQGLVGSFLPNNTTSGFIAFSAEF